MFLFNIVPEILDNVTSQEIEIKVTWRAQTSSYEKSKF